MARLEDLIDEIADPTIRREIAQEVQDLKKQQRFGVVFEKHIPETVALRNMDLEVGSRVMVRTQGPGAPLYRILEMKADTAIIGLVDNLELEEEQPLKDLHVVKQLDEPVFPTLTPIGEVERSDSRPSHAVINAENFHALRLLLHCFEGRADCIYIDPPYNTPNSRDWKYNNRFVDRNDTYRHSKWLSMMEKRLQLARRLLNEDGVLIVTIDHNEHAHLTMLLEDVFKGYELHTVAIVHNPRGIQGDNFSYTNEFAIFVLPRGRTPIAERDLDPEERKGNSSNLRNWGGESERRHAKNCFYPIYIRDGNVVDFGDVAPDDFHPAARLQTLEDGTLELWPIDSQGTERKWRYARQSVETVRHLLEVKEPRQVEVFISKTAGKYKTVWAGPKYDASTHGTQLVRKVAGVEFPFPKSLYAVHDALHAVTAHKPDALILDFFAGSGTTLHATCLLNTVDAGRRRCILVTNNEVDDKRARKLHRQGIYPGDAAYEAVGIFNEVTRPRSESLITGTRPDGEPIEGSYDAGDKRPLKDGFAENVDFFELTYLDPDAVDLGQHLKELLPLLWFSAGGFGERPPSSGLGDMFVPEDAPYAVLLNEAKARVFADRLNKRPDITHVYVLTDSAEAFAETRARISGKREVRMLYRDYLSDLGQKLL